MTEQTQTNTNTNDKYTEIYKKCVLEFSQINHKLDVAIQTCKDYGEYYTLYGNVEIEYGKKMIGLVAMINPNISSKSTKKLNPLLSSTREYVSDDIQEYLTTREQLLFDRAEEKCRLGKQIIDEIGSAFTTLGKEIETKKKKLATEVQRKIGIYHDVTTFATRSESYYLTQLKEMKDLINKMNETNDQKLMVKYNKMLQNYTTAKNDYENAVIKANDCMELLFEKEMIEAIKECHELLNYFFCEFHLKMEAVQRIHSKISMYENEFKQNQSNAIEKIEDEDELCLKFFNSINFIQEPKKRMELKIEELPEVKMEINKEDPLVTNTEKSSSSRKWGLTSIMNNLTTSISLSKSPSNVADNQVKENESEKNDTNQQETTNKEKEKEKQTPKKSSITPTTWVAPVFVGNVTYTPKKEKSKPIEPKQEIKTEEKVQEKKEQKEVGTRKNILSKFTSKVGNFYSQKTGKQQNESNDQQNSLSKSNETKEKEEIARTPSPKVSFSSLIGRFKKDGDKQEVQRKSSPFNDFNDVTANESKENKNTKEVNVSEPSIKSPTPSHSPSPSLERKESKEINIEEEEKEKIEVKQMSVREISTVVIDEINQNESNDQTNEFEENKRKQTELLDSINNEQNKTMFSFNNENKQNEQEEENEEKYGEKSISEMMAEKQKEEESEDDSLKIVPSPNVNTVVSEDDDDDEIEYLSDEESVEDIPNSFI